jgi:hypothetical protein
MIEEFIDYICGLLDIEVPEIRILKGEALTDTTLACVIDGIVYIVRFIFFEKSAASRLLDFQYIQEAVYGQPPSLPTFSPVLR